MGYELLEIKVVLLEVGVSTLVKVRPRWLGKTTVSCCIRLPGGSGDWNGLHLKILASNNVDICLLFCANAVSYGITL